MQGSCTVYLLDQYGSLAEHEFGLVHALLVPEGTPQEEVIRGIRELALAMERETVPPEDLLRGIRPDWQFVSDVRRIDLDAVRHPDPLPLEFQSADALSEREHAN